MVFVWRGMGIIVPIIFFLCGTAVHFFIDDSRLGNPRFMGWSLFYSAIVLILPALAAIGGKAEDGQPKKKHDFFFIPIFVWVLIFGGLSAWLLIFAGKDAPAEEDSGPKKPVAQRLVRLWNTSDDSISYIIADTSGLIASEDLEPHIFGKIRLDEGSYLFSASDQAGNITLQLPDEKYKNDRSRYVLRKDADGPYYERMLKGETPDTTDYDEAWLLVNGSYDMAFIDITSVCKEGLTADEVKASDWTRKLSPVYDGRDLMEPILKAPAGGFVTALLPGEEAPSSLRKGENVQMLILVNRDEPVTNEILTGKIIRRFKLEDTE